MKAKPKIMYGPPSKCPSCWTTCDDRLAELARHPEVVKAGRRFTRAWRKVAKGTT